MPDSLPGAQWWEPALNMLSSIGGSGDFPDVPDRATITASPWLLDHHFSTKSGHNVIYSYGYQIWQVYANYDTALLDPGSSTSAWQKFYDNSHKILNGTDRMPYQTDSAQWDSFRTPDGLSAPIQGVKDWLTTHLTDIQNIRNSIATNESTIQGQAADVMWQIFDHFHYGMNFVAGQLDKALTYLGDASNLLHDYREALVAAWNKWLAGSSGTNFDTGKGYTLPDSQQLVSPVGALNAMARVITYHQGRHHWDRGLHLPVPDNFAGDHDMASWGMWQEIEEGAKKVWVEKLKQLDDAAIKTAFDTLAAKYRMAVSALQLTAPTFGPIDGGVTDDPNGTNDPNGNNNDVNDLLNHLGLGNDNPNDITPPPDTGGTDNITAPPPPDTGGITAPPGTGNGDLGGGDLGGGDLGGGDLGGGDLGNQDLLTNPPGGGDGGGDGGLGGGFITAPPGGTSDSFTPPGGGSGTGTDGYLVPDGNGGYQFEPSSDFITNPVPSGAIPGRMVTGSDGRQTFQPSTIGETSTAPDGSTPGYLVPDGSGGYEFKPATSFPNASDVPAGAIAGYQVDDGGGRSHFVPSTANDSIDGGDLITSPPSTSYTPPPTVSRDLPTAPAEGANGGADYLTAPPPIGGAGGSYAVGSDGSVIDLSTGQPVGSGAAAGTGVAAAAAANQQGNNVPLYPPMAGGMGGMGGQQGQNQERQRTTWLSEDEKVWGTDPDVAPAVLGRGKRKRKAAEEEEFEYATYPGKRPGTHAGKPQRPEDEDRRGQGGTGSTAGV